RIRTRRRARLRSKASLITNPNDFKVGRLIGSYGFINITSYSGFQSGIGVEPGFVSDDIGRLRIQDVGEGSVKIRLYEGRITQGPLKGTRVIFKVYPGQRAGGVEADLMAVNELNGHLFLQSNSKDVCQNLLILLGGFETATGEQWLAFRDDGKYSSADYAKVTSEKVLKNRSLGEQQFWNPFQQEQIIRRRRFFVIKLLRGAISGLAYMHDNDRLHQSLGPASVVLNTMMEREAAYLVPRLRDLAFSVDIRQPHIEDGPGTLSAELWRRASAAGAFTPMEKRAFGIADDMQVIGQGFCFIIKLFLSPPCRYEAGLLFAYLAVVPFCEAGVMDSISLQRLLESTFQLDLEAARDYFLSDDRLLEAVKFLDLGDGAGWELLQAMLNPDFRRRPTAEAILNHRFMTGSVL
ncbi:hypothetical protein RJ641_007895, partial [Dillenia turbinata]